MHWNEIFFLRRHGQAGRLKYCEASSNLVFLAGFSGAIESGIRRVINLRLKEAMRCFGKSEHAEVDASSAQPSGPLSKWDESD